MHTPRLAPNRTSAWAQYTIEVDDREAVEAAMREAGVPTTVHYPVALHQQPVFMCQTGQPRQKPAKVASPTQSTPRDVFSAFQYIPILRRGISNA